MKIPLKPPSFQDQLLEAVKKPETIIRLSNNLNPLWNNRYIHWNKLQHLSPPNGLTHEEWWLATKLARGSLLREIPLRDVKGTPFKYALPDPALEYLHCIDQDAGGLIQLNDKDTINPNVQERYLVHSLFEEAITSSQLEGAATTRKVAREMLRTQRAAKTKSEQMILNNYTTMCMLKEKAKEDLSVTMILELHRHLANKTLDDDEAAGRFRKDDEDIRVFDNMALGETILHTPPPSNELEFRIQALCDFANGKTPSGYMHPVIRAILLHFWLAYDHPFVDGNGRCARALFYWAMLKHGYWLCEHVSISRILCKAPSQYARSFLYTETDDNDCTYFLLYNLQVLSRAIQELHSYIAKSTVDLHSIEKLLRATHENFNYRQLDIIQHALRHNDDIYTIKGHKTTHKIAYETARRDFLGLVASGLFEQKLRGKEIVFLPAEDIQNQIQYGSKKQK
jgi:Fic family protein